MKANDSWVTNWQSKSRSVSTDVQTPLSFAFRSLLCVCDEVYKDILTSDRLPHPPPSPHAVRARGTTLNGGPQPTAYMNFIIRLVFVCLPECWTARRSQSHILTFSSIESNGTHKVRGWASNECELVSLNHTASSAHVHPHPTTWDLHWHKQWETPNIIPQSHLTS